MSITIATRMYASYWLVARQVPSSVGFGELSLPPPPPHVIIVQTPVNLKIISLEKSWKH